MKGVEKKFFNKREAIPIKVKPEEAELVKKWIDELEKYTSEVKEKYSQELKDWTDFGKEVVKELGKEYAFQKILIDEKGKFFAINSLFPDFLIVPEKYLQNYSKLKEFMVRKPYLYEDLKTAIKEMFFHEKEHVLKGPAQRGRERLYEEITKLREKLEKKGSLKERIKKTLKGKRRELIKELEEIKKEKEIIENEKKEIEKQVELQKIIIRKDVDEKNIINKMAIYQKVFELLDGGVDLLARPEKLTKAEKMVLYLFYFSDVYPSFKTTFHFNLTERYLQIHNELKKEYQEWKKERMV
ncbi:MAG: hypothetical protein QMC93_03675 [Patescibacteria group bacterium]|nr:hypothetical protein [Patescibacteria group bacterium]